MDPLGDIEDKTAQIDMGIMAGRVFEGALQETDNFVKAYFATAAIFHGMFKSAQKDETEDDSPD